MPALKSVAPPRRKRLILLAVNVLVAAAVMLSFASQPDMMVRALGVGASYVYLFFAAALALRRTRRDSEAAVKVPA